MVSTETVDGAQYFAEQQSENDFLRNVIAYAVARGWGEEFVKGMTRQDKAACLRPYHTHIAKKGAAGFPDLVLVRAPRLIFAELKRAIPEKCSPSLLKKLMPTPSQQKWLDELKIVSQCTPIAEGEFRVVEVFLWRPTDWFEIERALA